MIIIIIVIIIRIIIIIVIIIIIIPHIRSVGVLSIKTTPPPPSLPPLLLPSLPHPAAFTQHTAHSHPARSIHSLVARLSRTLPLSHTAHTR